MPLFLRIIVLSSLIVVMGCGQTTFDLYGGQKLPLGSLKSSWVVVNYWATWCKPCVEEIPELNRLDEQDGIVVFGVNYDGLVGDALGDEAERLGIRYRLIATDPADDIQVKRPGALPATVLIDGRGVTREVLYGPQTAASITEKMVQLSQAP